GLAQLGELGEGGGEVLASTAGQTHPIAEDGRDDAHAVPLHLVRPFVLVVDVLAPAEGGEHRGDRLVHLGRRLGRGGGRIRRGGGSLRRPVVVGPAAVGPVVIGPVVLGPVVLGLVLHQVQQPVRLRLLLRRGG